MSVEPPSSAAPPLLHVRGLCKDYGSEPVFADVNLQVSRGEFVAILGESGVGKSTLLNCIAGLDTAPAGSVHIAGTEITALAESAQALFRRAHLGFVFQAFHVLPHLSVAHNVGLPLLLRGRAHWQGGGAWKAALLPQRAVQARTGMVGRRRLSEQRAQLRSQGRRKGAQQR